MRSFLGVAGYYRSSFNNFASRTPLAQLLNKNTDWSEEREQTFQAIKQAVVEPTVTKVFSQSTVMVLRTDSGVDLGAVLAQIVDGEERPVVFLERTSGLSII